MDIFIVTAVDLKPKILEYVKALERIKYCYGYDTFGKYYNGKKSAYLNAANLIDEAPTVEERKHGYWKGKPLAGYCTVRCSYCRVSFEGNSGRWKYCPECGAKMDGVNDGCF